MKTLEEIQSYANAVIYAFERQKKIKAQPLKGWQLKVILNYIKYYLEQKKDGVTVEDFLKEQPNIEQFSPVQIA